MKGCVSLLILLMALALPCAANAESWPENGYWTFPETALPEELRLAARDYDPSRINKYVTELAARFHRFYTACRIKHAEPELRDARLLLSDATRRVIALSLSVIGVSAPERM